MNYISTRGGVKSISASRAILKGIADDGGLFVPETMPHIEKQLDDLIPLSYHELAIEILKLFLTDFSEEELWYCIKNAYDEKFETTQIAPLVNPSDGKYFLELFHGRTLAFKDMALSILPYFLKISAKKNSLDKKIIILTATSGDTGKAALEGFADVEGTGVAVFFPENGVSKIQKLQMTTQEGSNTFVAGISDGNFDDAQTAVKKIFADTAFGEELSDAGYILSSANSINIGRLVPQIVYYFYAYARLAESGEISPGDKVNFTVPTGNFGNILAGYYAREIGLPINKLICASNDNKVLYDYFETGEYDKNREFILTISPSMDILVSSNLERLLYHISGTGDKTKELMNSLNSTGKFDFPPASAITGQYASDKETLDCIKKVYSDCGYVMDTHTAVAYAAYEKYLAKTNDRTKNIIVSTASPFKFPESVCSAIDEKYLDMDCFELLPKLAGFTGREIPEQIKDLDKKSIGCKTTVCKTNELKDVLRNWIIGGSVMLNTAYSNNLHVKN